jgi:signal peptidase I
MTPIIKNGDWLTLKHNSNDIRVGSIIAYRRERKIIVHRVIKMQAQSLITKGDFNYHIDEAVDITSVIGKVIAVKNRRGLYRLDTKLWYVIGYIIASTPFLFTHTYRIMYYIKI